jgi:hypothetical protein
MLISYDIQCKVNFITFFLNVTNLKEGEFDTYIVYHMDY